jgi:phosphoglucosamine mutase
MGKLFGTDGIRGEANRYPMDAAMAFAVGQAVTYVLRKENHRTRVVIGKDTRISGYMVESAIEAGVTSMGGCAQMVGVLPTPGIAYITESMRADAGFVCPPPTTPPDNGIKIFSGRGSNDRRPGDRDRGVDPRRNLRDGPIGADMGRAQRLTTRAAYTVFLKSTFPAPLPGGDEDRDGRRSRSAYKVAPAVFRELGADLTVINNTPNGFNINENCGSQHTRTAAGGGGDRRGDRLAFDCDGDG